MDCSKSCVLLMINLCVFLLNCPLHVLVLLRSFECVSGIMNVVLFYLSDNFPFISDTEGCIGCGWENGSLDKLDVTMYLLLEILMNLFPDMYLHSFALKSYVFCAYS